MLRDQDDQVRAFYNVCRHRGGPLVTDDTGTVPGGLVCGFHGWTYDLNGKLINLRDKRDFVGLDMSCRKPGAGALRNASATGSSSTRIPTPCRWPSTWAR